MLLQVGNERQSLREFLSLVKQTDQREHFEYHESLEPVCLTDSNDVRSETRDIIDIGDSRLLLLLLQSAIDTQSCEFSIELLSYYYCYCYYC